MPDLDDLIRGRLQARARPVDAQPGLFDGIDRRRGRRVVKRRLSSAAATLAFLVAVVGGIALVGGSGGIAPATNTQTLPGGPQNGEIVSVVAGGTSVNHLSSLWAGKTQLTPDGTFFGEPGFVDRAPSVYPSGSLVAFTRQVSVYAGAGLYTVPFHGTAAGPCPTCGFVATRVLDSSWSVADPAWSPDGSKIAFAGGGKSRPVGIYTVGIIPPTRPTLVYSFPNDLSVVAHPSWSPDGSKLVYAYANAAISTPPDFDLYVVASDGTGGAIDITPTSSAPGGSDSQVQPAWSPDGKHIVFASQQGGTTSGPGYQQVGVSRSSIAIISPDGTGLRYLTGGALIDRNPSWSPDGKQIVFDSETQPPIQSQLGIFTMAWSGGPQRFVRIGSDPSWQPIQGGNSGEIQVLPPETQIPGIPYPVCQADVLRAFFLSDVEAPPVYLFTKPGVLGCRQTSSAPAFLAIEVHGLGPFPSTVVTGPISCSPTCRILAAPDLNNDGMQELAVMVGGSSMFAVVQLYQVGPDGHFVASRLPGCNTFVFNWGKSGIYRAGIACSAGSSTPPGESLDVWTALKRAGLWRVTHIYAQLRNIYVKAARVFSETTKNVSGLPAGGGRDFCGAKVLLAPSPGP